ncbi:MDR family MFS transporter [Allosediminivita pacifica]|uniref:EmrB/QacA subfamily drug resistance transporter n=1 Tax=Allosediminivita pacifica TaxID=1267769 RepID=A0A2T6AJ63_9RHOB|nr:MDR family MFS transporter [Allosediminivita pacifica]PTX43859.1 EmrB/QacA subfamily drug resistance transporter [Allosediminivita pacifica]GGB22348.1 MFS transporter [Allosediminivita pacifica]
MSPMNLSPLKGLDRTAVLTAVAVISGVITVILDTTIVSVALHELADELSVPVSTIQWVSTAYLLALGTVIPTTSWLQAKVGGKRLWMIALSVFMAGSVLCSLAWNAPSLIAFRVVQGMGGGVMMPLMMTMVAQAAPQRDMARLMSIVSIPAALGPILGPVLGGFILGNASWHWLFLVNAPVGLIGLFLAWKLIPASEPEKGARLDVVGLLMLSPALVAILWGLSNVSGETGFADPLVFLPVGAGVALLVAFALWSRRRGAKALVHLDVLKSRPTLVASGMMFLFGASLFGGLTLLPLYFQDLRGADALGAGMLLIPQGVGSLVSRFFAGRLIDGIGARLTALMGFSLITLATVPFAMADGETSMQLLSVALFFRGMGIGTVVVPVMSSAFTELERNEVPHASIIIRVCQQVGGAMGVALVAVILTTVTQSSGSSATGFGTAFGWVIGFAVLGIGVALALPGRRRAEETAPA